jgi:hypothetical protein
LDRIFGTFKLLSVIEMKYGLKEFEPEEKQTFLYPIKSPIMNIERIETDVHATDDI